MIHAILSLALFLQTGSGDAPAPPINALCPIAREAIDGKSTAIEAGQVIGFCCPGCIRMFETWSETRREAFVAQSLGSPADRSAGIPTASAPTTPPAAAEPDPYPLSQCPVSGDRLDSRGDPVVRVYREREVRFCSEDCVARFEADERTHFAKIDAELIRDQKRYYPLERDLVTDRPLTENGEDLGLDFIHRNRLVRVRDASARKQFSTSPREYMAKLDRAAAGAQRSDYPLTACVVTGSELGSMGDPSELIVAGRLLRFCCAGCEPDVLDDPATYLAKIDAAWSAIGRYRVPSSPPRGK